MPIPMITDSLMVPGKCDVCDVTLLGPNLKYCCQNITIWKDASTKVMYKKKKRETNDLCQEKFWAVQREIEPSGKLHM